jgi:glycosyltransferase involved in cell wall biosynthesis
MHIVHVTHRAWPVLGGAEEYVQRVAAAQVEDGHRVTVVATDAEALAAIWDRSSDRVSPAAGSRHEGVRIRRLPLRTLPAGRLAFPVVRRLTWLVSHASQPVGIGLARFSPWLPDLARVLAREAADLLFGWNITLEGLTAAVAREAKRRYVPWVAVPLLHLGRPRFYTMPHQLGLLRRASAVVALTAGEREFLVARGLAADRVRVVSPGIDLSRADRADGRRFRQAYGLTGPVVLSLGPPAYDKGTPHVLSAMHRLWNDGRSATLVLVGPGTREYQGPVSEQGVQCPIQRVLRTGRLSDREKWDALDAATVLAQPSRTESFGLAYLEAWARGKPVVAARAGAVPDVVDEGADGLLVRFGDVMAVADALRSLLDSPEWAASLGAHGRAKVIARYRWEAQYPRLSAFVEDTLDRWRHEQSA